MKVIFKGSPVKIRKQMHEFLGYEPETDSDDDTPDTEAETDFDDSEPGVDDEPELICPHCNVYTSSKQGWLDRHVKYCKSNPARVPHPKDGIDPFADSRAKPETNDPKADN